MSNTYQSIPDLPESITPQHILVRMVDGLGFRYRWATEGLTPSNFEFKPCDTSKSIKELLIHIYQLAYITNKTFGGEVTMKKEFTTNDSIIEETLSVYNTLRTHLKQLNEKDLESCIFTHPKYDREFPFWYMINGPLADALTHVGQIASWRRIAGNPQPKGVNPLLGEKI